MMHLITNEKDCYKYYIEISDVRNQKHIKFLTNFSGAKDPDGLHKKLEFFLEKEEFERFKTILNSY